MIDKQAILVILKEYFETNGSVTVDDQGLVSVVGGCKLRDIKTVTQLPVLFASVGGHFYCFNNQLTSLEGAPQSVGGNFYCFNNRLTSLEGAPQSVGEDFYCDNNQLTSLEGAPQSVGGDFYCSGNRLTSLDGLPKSIKGVFQLDYIPNLPMLRLFKVRGITEVGVRDTVTNKWGHPVEHIINRYIHLGINGILPCAAELYKAGYGGNAKL